MRQKIQKRSKKAPNIDVHFAAKLSKDPTFSGDLKNHKGSIMDWCYEGFDLVDDKGETTKNVHGVATKWAKLFPQDKGYNIVL